MAAFSILPRLTSCTSINGSGAGSAANVANENFTPDVDVALTAAQKQLQVFSGNKTHVFSYTSNILKAENAAVENLSGSWLGPVFKVKQGQKIRVRFKNQLPRESIIHWHGLHISLEMKVKIALKFEDYTVIYVYHCHNLEHEYMGMMRNYEVIQ